MFDNTPTGAHTAMPWFPFATERTVQSKDAVEAETQKGPAGLTTQDQANATYLRDFTGEEPGYFSLSPFGYATLNDAEAADEAAVDE